MLGNEDRKETFRFPLLPLDTTDATLAVTFRNYEGFISLFQPLDLFAKYKYICVCIYTYPYVYIYMANM